MLIYIYIKKKKKKKKKKKRPLYINLSSAFKRLMLAIFN
jgi:hypothetical protein